MSNYPLGHHPDELLRLDAQARLLHDPVLDTLAAHASSCLEVGCGSGANAALLRRANPQINYTGIDISPLAVQSARMRFAQLPQVQFHEMNACEIHLDQQFDLIFTKLVLWSVGPQWRMVLREALRLLKPGGVFYALEPCCQLIQMYPEKSAVRERMRRWDEAVLRKGMDPFIGTAVGSAMIDAGFRAVEGRLFTVSAFGRQVKKYTGITGNFKGYYTGVAAENLGIGNVLSEEKSVIAEFDLFRESDFVMDALFASSGVR